MKKCWIEMPICSGDYKFRISLVAEIVDVAPHITNATFALHPHPMWCSDVWRISNIETGLAISDCDSPKRKKTVANAITFLKTKNNQDIQRGYRRFRRKTKE